MKQYMNNDGYKFVNRYIAVCKENEYYRDNSQRILATMKEYYTNNSETRRAYN